MKTLLLGAAIVGALGFAEDDGATSLEPEPRAKYEAYIRATEARIQHEVRSATYLWSARSPARWQLVRSGQVVVEPWNETGDSDIGDAIIHDWIGSVFIPGVKLDRVVSFLQDYNSHKHYYHPEVVDSRLVGHDGNDWELRYRLVKHKIVTVVLDVNQTVNFYPLSQTRVHTRSVATRIAEIRNAGTPSEHEAKPGKDHGFLWRLNTYWRLEEKDGGVYVECQTISLTRSPPFGLGWLINPIIRTFPPESLARLLAATRDAVRSRG
ncbi:MAG: hypothetical protein ABSH47_06630 [Bryobacteraceae bacterium]|jgi:hypothetical protein